MPSEGLTLISLMKRESGPRYAKLLTSIKSPNTITKRLKHRSFLHGDLVLRKVTLSMKEPNSGKLGPTWEGPYKIVKVSSPRTYWLEDMSEKALPHP